MISRIRGTLLQRETERVEIMTPSGVGYEIEIPLSTYEHLPAEGEEVELRTHHFVREDSAELYGFATELDRVLFGRLITASGVGPRLAMNMLSTLAPDRLIRAIQDRDSPTLRQVRGLGVKMAERLSLELGDKLDDLATMTAGPRPEGPSAEEAVGALVALGYSLAQATTSVREALDDEPSLEGPELIKASLTRIK